MNEVQDEMLEEALLFCHILAITVDQQDHLADFSKKDTRGGLGFEESGVDV